MTEAILKPAAVPRPRVSGARARWRDALVTVPFVTPAWLLLVGILVIPIVVVLVLSFTSYELGNDTFRWVGFANYMRLAGDPGIARSMLITLAFVLMTVPVATFVALWLAMLIQSVTAGRGFYRAALFVPVTSTLVAMATVWKYLLHGSVGPVNQLLAALGLPTFDFFSSPSLVLTGLALIYLWQHIGFNVILFTAGLLAIPEELYEAAALDGAQDPWERLRLVTLPMIGPTFMFVLITSTISAFKVFDTVAVLTKGGPNGASEVLLYRLYLEAFQFFRIGSGAALTIVFLVIVGTLSLVQSLAIDRKVHYQ